MRPAPVMTPGSSPHARGGRAVGSFSGGSTRLIPACAGRAPLQWRRGDTMRAHPRMRGEGAQESRPGLDALGSSPHARGGRRHPVHRGDHLRLIPACAGRARSAPPGPGGRSAHPRMRGEGAFRRSLRNRVVGSSPHARGGLLGHVHEPAGQRLIPACAGRARGGAAVSGGDAAHPRMRGEGSVCRPSRRSRPGSSPHARGGLFLTWGYVRKSAGSDSV